jgi:hypothetical protein
MVDPNEAPPGYKAMPGDASLDQCRKCAFDTPSLECTLRGRQTCIGYHRKDQSFVYYVKAESKYPTNRGTYVKSR